MTLCKYQNILGKPGVGPHSHLGLPFAPLDLILTIGAAYGITHYFKVPFLYSFGGLMVTAVTLHHIFGVNTVLNNYLFGPSKC